MIITRGRDQEDKVQSIILERTMRCVVDMYGWLFCARSIIVATPNKVLSIVEPHGRRSAEEPPLGGMVGMIPPKRRQNGMVWYHTWSRINVSIWYGTVTALALFCLDKSITTLHGQPMRRHAGSI